MKNKIEGGYVDKDQNNIEYQLNNLEGGNLSNELIDRLLLEAGSISIYYKSEPGVDSFDEVEICFPRTDNEKYSLGKLTHTLDENSTITDTYQEGEDEELDKDEIKKYLQILDMSKCYIKIF